MTDGRRYIVTLQDTGHEGDIPVEVRLRRFLKSGLRFFRFEVTDIKEQPGDIKRLSMIEGADDD